MAVAAQKAANARRQQELTAQQPPDRPPPPLQPPLGQRGGSASRRELLDRLLTNGQSHTAAAMMGLSGGPRWRSGSSSSSSAAAAADGSALTTTTNAAAMQQQPPQPPSISNTVIEEQSVDGLGRFTAYADARIRAVFADRAILHLDSTHGTARITLPDGSRAEVATANPVGVEGYVAAAVQFAQWALKTPAQRDAALRAQGRVEAELATTARMAALCEYGSSVRVPAAVAAVAAAADVWGRDQGAGWLGGGGAVGVGSGVWEVGG